MLLLIKGDDVMIDYLCKRCGHVSITDIKCDHCGYDHLETFKYEEITEFHKHLDELKNNPEYDAVIAEQTGKGLYKQSSANISNYAPKPKCPTCGSTNIKDISTLNRVVSVGLFGLASGKIGKTKECKSCGYKW